MYESSEVSVLVVGACWFYQMREVYLIHEHWKGGVSVIHAVRKGIWQREVKHAYQMVTRCWSHENMR